MLQPKLFGLDNSNRDFTDKRCWGKNQFNSSFPASLACYMYSKGLEPVYLRLNKNLGVYHDKISTHKLFIKEPNTDEIFFAFENDFTPYRKYIIGSLPRVDLVIQDSDTNDCFSCLEIKLTALPDNATHHLLEKNYGCEIVVRPDTIVYLALSIAKTFNNRKNELSKLLQPISKLMNKIDDANYIIKYISDLYKVLDNLIVSNLNFESPLLLQPVWKTKGKSPVLEDYCLDIFVWSNYAFTRLFIDILKNSNNINSIGRTARTLIWLIKMLFDFSINGRFNQSKITNSLVYATRNDKAFAVNGSITNPYMSSKELLKPRVKKDEIKNIILNGGEQFLSPERRFDAILYFSSDLF